MVAISRICAARVSSASKQRGLRLTELAHRVWGEFIEQGDTVVDATCGNGHDTAFLAQAIGPTGRLVAIDIQASAIESTRTRVEALLPDVEQRPSIEYIHGSHADLQEHVGMSNVASLICWNTGYLPNSDKTVKTEIATTIEGLEASLEVLADGGLLSMLVYTGHDGGIEEYEAIREFAAALSSAHWKTSEYKLLNSPTAPTMVLIWKSR